MSENFWDILAKRRSVRNFSDKEVSDEDIRKIISAAYLAPSGSNVKNYDFIIIKNKNVKEKMHNAVENKVRELSEKMKSMTRRKMFLSYSKYFTFFSKAPVVIAVVMHKYDSLSARILEKYENNEEYVNIAGVQNVAAAVENLLLAAAALDLGACWMTGPMIAKQELEKILDIKPFDKLIAVIPVGFPKEKIIPNKQKPNIELRIV